MTSGSVAKGLMGSESGSAGDDATMSEAEVSNDLERPPPIGRFSGVNSKKVPDEDFRLAVEKTFEGFATLPDNWDDLTVREQRDWIYPKVRARYTNLPNSLTALWVGSMINGDAGQVLDSAPEWLDREKFRRGQDFAMANYAAISLAEMLSLHTLFSFDHGLKPLIVTGKSSEPFTSFKRYLSTGRRVRNWYSSDVWTPGTEAYKDIQAVRKMHANVRKQLRNASPREIDEAATIRDVWSPDKSKIREDFRDSCPAPAEGQCPYILSGEDRFKRPNALNQTEMAGTQFGFMGLVVLFPERFGIHGASDDDLEAYCHVWRGLGYLLGVEDEFNFCNGSLEEVKQRSRDFLEYWVKPNLRDVTPEWEHMMRCVIEGIRYYFPTVTYEQSLLYLADMMDIRMPRLRASVSYIAWIRFHLMKFTFFWTARIPGISATLNRGLMMSVDRALNYTNEEIEALRKRSEVTLSKGIAETTAVEKDSTIAVPTVWQRAPFVVFSSAFLLLNLSIVVKEYAGKLMFDGAGSTLQG